MIVLFFNHKTPVQYVLDLKRKGSKNYNLIKRLIDRVLNKYYNKTEEIHDAHRAWRM